MSHDLDFTKGRAAIAYSGQTPWHGFGEEMEPEMTQDQWLTAAGMDYQVLELPVNFEQPRNYGHVNVQIPNRKALVRDDTHDLLSVVSEQYKVVQPDEVLAFFKTLIDD